MSGSISSITSLSTMMQQQKVAQQLEVTMLKKAQDIQEQQGEAALKLLQSAAPSAANSSIDVYV